VLNTLTILGDKHAPDDIALTPAAKEKAAAEADQTLLGLKRLEASLVWLGQS